MDQVPPTNSPASTAVDSSEIEMSQQEEPILAGTLFLTMVFLMMVFGFWITLYITLLNL
ncbi:MAG: hypothetical protein KDD73_00685 [Anaerolineales bacterium]|nr:hypothetical protein [Anaerolineales bacterium]MCB9128424.1 hypothetical protein [Ardenticatenales bacterium]